MIETPPPRIAPKIKSAPKVRQLYWCDFPKDAQLPEFWKRRPVIIISIKNTLYSTATVIPCTTSPQKPNTPSFALTTTIDERNGWAVCDKPTTVAVSRLVPDKQGIIRMPEAEFDAMMRVVFSCLPRLQSIVSDT